MLAAVIELPTPSGALTPRDRLYARFVEYVLSREAEGSPRKRTDAEPLKHWLGWLAEEMKRRAQTQFSFEELDNSWLPSPQVTSWHVSLIVGLFFALLVALAFGLVEGLTGGLVVGLGVWVGIGLFVGYGGGLLVGLIFGLLGGLMVGLGWAAKFVGLGGGLVVGLVGGLGVGLVVGLAGRAQAIEELYFEWLKWKEALAFGLIGGLVGGSMIRLVGGQAGGLVIGLVVGLGVALVEILQPTPVSGRSSPNHGTFRSLRYAATLFFSGWFLGLGVAAALPQNLRWSPLVAFTIAGAGLALGKGGEFTVRHYAIRLLLRRYGFAPFRYVRFLNEASERLFLTRRGGTYEFFHLTFRDYMADTYGSKKLKPWP